MACSKQLISDTERSWWTRQYAQRTPVKHDWHDGQAHYIVCAIDPLHRDLVRSLKARAQVRNVRITTILGAIIATTVREVLGLDAIMVGMATAQRNPITETIIGPIFDHLPVLAAAPLSATPNEIIGALDEACAEARRYRLPSVRIEEIANTTVPYDVALNYRPFRDPKTIAIGSTAASITAHPVSIISSVALSASSSVAPPLAFILRPDGANGLRGDVTGTSALYGPRTVHELSARFVSMVHSFLFAHDMQINNLQMAA